MRILFLSKSPDATEFYRCRIPAKFLEKAGHEVRVDYMERFGRMPDSGIKEKDVEWSEVVVLQRPVNEFALKAINKIKENYPDKILVGDYDDDYENVPSWNPGYSFVRSNEKYWKSIIPLYDGVMVSTEPLKKVIEKYTAKPISVITNGFDYDMFDSLSPFCNVSLSSPSIDGNKLSRNYSVTGEQFNQLMKDKIVVAWAGSKFHFVDLDWLADDLAGVCRDRDDIVFLFVGYIQERIVRNIPVNRLFICNGISPISNFYRLMKGLKIDIFLAPVDPCVFNRSKSCLKTMEAMSCGFYPLASDWDPYENDIGNGVLVGYENGDWKKSILGATSLVLSGESKALIEENKVTAREKYDAGKRTDLYVKFFESLLEKRKKDE